MKNNIGFPGVMKPNRQDRWINQEDNMQWKVIVIALYYVCDNVHARSAAQPSDTLISQ